MPYSVRKSGCPESKPYAVVKSATGEVLGCHETESSAEAQMRALYANEDD